MKAFHHVFGFKKKMKYLNLLVIPVLFLAMSCTVSRLQKKGTVKPDIFSSSFTFETHKGVIGFDIDISGEKSRFLFDTGADLTLVQRDSIHGRTAKYMGASKRKMELGRTLLDTLTIHDIHFEHTYALVGDMVGLKEQIPNFGGILGQNVINKANWLIDYPQGRIQVSSQNLADETFTEIKIRRQNGGNPYTFLEMDGRRYKVVIDLGSTSNINLPVDSKFGKAVLSSVKLTERTRDRYTLGGLQIITEKVGVIPKVRLGEFELDNVEVNINVSSQPRIGIRFFEEFLIYIDHSQGGTFKLKEQNTSRHAQ